MKKPDDSAVGSSRKTLPNRKSIKSQKTAGPSGAAKRKSAPRRRNVLDRDVEKELVRVFGEK